jgi:hypothetical protein
MGVTSEVSRRLVVGRAPLFRELAGRERLQVV